jgi:hypothetical protein
MFDAVVALVRLRQDHPRHHHGPRPPRHPRPHALRRLHHARQVQGRDVTIQDVFEAVGAYAAGKMTEGRLHALENAACPGAGACGGQFTANTMATAADSSASRPHGQRQRPRRRPDKDESPAPAGS